MSQAACESWVWGTRLEGAAKATAGLGQAKIDTASPEESTWFAQQNALLADTTAKLEDALSRFPGAAVSLDQHGHGGGKPHG